MNPLRPLLSGGIVNAIPALIIGLFVLIAPILFIPSSAFPFGFTKTLALALAVIAALVLYIITLFKNREIQIPLNIPLLTVWLLPTAYLLSTIFSSNLRVSLMGHDMGTDTFLFILLGALLATLVSLVFREAKQIYTLYGALVVSFLLVALFHIIRIVIGPSALSFGVLTSTTSTPVGVWNDLAIFAGLIVVLSLITLTGWKNRSLKTTAFFYTGLSVGLLFLIIVNFSLAWWIVGFFALATFVYSVIAGGRSSISSQSESNNFDVANIPSRTSRISFTSLFVLAVTLILLFFGSGLGTFISSTLDTAAIDVRPSWQSTIDIGKATYEQSPVFGSGANTFDKQWLLYKPEGVNETVFWNVEFPLGISSIPTSFITTGLLGTVAWILFLAALLVSGFRAFIMRATGDPFSHYVAVSSFVLAAFLWISVALFTPSPVLYALAFVFTGTFLSSLRGYNLFGEFRISFTNNPKLGFVAVLMLTIVFLGSIAGLFAIGERYVAAVWFQKASLTQDLNQATEYANRAVSLDNFDRYHRLLTNVYVSRLTTLINETETATEAFRNEFQTLLADAVASGQRAVQFDGTRSSNWFELSRAYESVAPLQIDGAYENAVRGLDEALTYDPRSPSLRLERAQLELSLGNTELGKQYLVQALDEKSNYTDAIFLLSQVQVSEGNVGEAIESVEAATIISPRNPVLFFQLGLLHFNENRDAEAIDALERAVNFDGNYSNARYFLGLAYYREGRNDEAIAQFEEIRKINPGNDVTDVILDNLLNNREPVPGIQRTQVDDLEGLPIE